MDTIRRKLVPMILLLPALCIGSSFAAWAQETEFNTVLFQATFKIEGPAGPNSVTLGTVFLMSKPIAGSTKFKTVLITAKHVLEVVSGDMAILNLRRRTASGWQRVRYPIKIRDAGQPLWTGPDEVDVAVMYITLPAGIQIPIISTSLLADDDMLSEFEVNPGEELICLGYPFGTESNSAGFPVLRSGKIASYPLLTTESTQKILFDFAIFPGNSGGPAFLSSKKPFSAVGIRTPENSLVL